MVQEKNNGYDKAATWQFPDARPDGWHVVPPDTVSAPDGVQQNWTVVPEGHPDAAVALPHDAYDALSASVRRHEAAKTVVVLVT